jgi:hypothetical protein
LIREQKKLIDERNKCIKSLEERIKTLEKRYENEAVSNDALVKQLKAQVDAQSSHIANLTFQIHQLTKSKMSLAAVAGSSSLQNVDLSSLNLNSNPDLSTSRSRRVKKESSFILNDMPDSSTVQFNNQSGNSANNNQFFSHTSNISVNTQATTGIKASKKSTSRRYSGVSADDSMPPIAQRYTAAVSIAGAENELISASHNSFLHEQVDAADVGNDSYRHHNVPRSTSRSSSARSDRSVSSAKSTLPPPMFNKADSVPPPDPKPFLQSSASTLHSRSKKDLIQRRALISLPPIKPYEIGQLAVECLIKPSANEKNNATN